MTISAFLGNVAAGTISGAIVAYFPMLRHGKLEPGASVNVSGHGNHTSIDQSWHNRTVLVDRRTTTITPNRPNKTTDSDTKMILVGVGAVAATIAFLFAWQFVLGALVGLSAVAGITYVRLARRPELFSEINRHAVVAQVLLSWLATVAVATFTFFTADGGRGMPGLESRIDLRFPGYSNSVTTRWNVLSHHTISVFNLLGLRGSMDLLYQVAALFLCALMIAVMAMRSFGADATLREYAGQKLGFLRRYLLAWAPQGRHVFDLSVIGGFAVLAIVMASGLVGHVIGGTL